MTQRTLTITLSPDWRAVLRAAGARARQALAAGPGSGSGYQGEQLNFETPEAFFGRLTKGRWAMVRALQTQGAAGVRELARRLDRDVKRVHEDAAVLIELGLVERDVSGRYVCPYTDIHVDMHLTVPESVAA